MVVYNFKQISVVPDAKQFIDIVLSMTQRKTPTVVHKGYKISRIRKFYMRKIKYTCLNYHEKFDSILNEFPKLNSIHPFYSDLINILYSRDHYKLALGQISTVKTTIDNITKDYIKLLKFADSLYRAKELKRIALGRMSTVVLKCHASLVYLEQVRMHLSRLPSIDPNTRTLLITGYPNVGKSSFINKISHADVEVQNYAFTTKSLYLGHFDYKYIRWQVIDTPGILDHPLDERNVIEMQAITALAHLYCSVLYFFDLSEQCGYTVEKQVNLFHSIKPLFQSKPVIVVCNKSDVRSISDLSSDELLLFDTVRNDSTVSKLDVIEMSNHNEHGINRVIQTSCDALLAARVERKLQGSMKSVNSMINRLQVVQPQPRDKKQRDVSIPESVLQQRAEKSQHVDIDTADDDYRQLIEDRYSKTAQYKTSATKQLQESSGGSGVFNYDWRIHWNNALENKLYSYDLVPEIIDGKNISDYIDPDIEQKLIELENEEELLLEQYNNQLAMKSDDSELDEDEQAAVQQIRDTRILVQHTNALRKSTANKPRVPRTAGTHSTLQAVKDFSEMGLATQGFTERTKLSAEQRLARRKRALSDVNNVDVDMTDDATHTGGINPGKHRRDRNDVRTLVRDRSVVRAANESTNKNTQIQRSFHDIQQATHATKLAQHEQGSRNKHEKTQRLGESDRRHFDKMPKHLFSGKRGRGKTDYR